MKNIFIGLLSLFLYFSSLTMSGACEFLKEQIGTPVSSIIEKYDNLDEPPGGGDPTATYVKEYDSLSLCENSQLENSVLKVFIKEGKLIGTEIEGAYGEAKNSRILDFAKVYLGYTTEEEIDEGWIGGIILSSFGERVVYGRVSHRKGNFETLTISKPEFREYLYGPSVIEIMM